MALDKRRKRLLILCSFGVACAGVIVMMLHLSGVQLSEPYKVVFTASDVDNLVEHGRVEIAGVVVGAVQSTEVTPSGAQAEISLFPQYAPLHQGATIRVGDRSLVEETYVDLKDGTGPALPDGAVLPASAVRPSTEIRDLLNSLDSPTRAALSQLMRSGGGATTGTAEQVGQLFSGFGKLGREGYTAIDAIAAQSQDLRSLVRDTTVFFKALDTGQGQIVSLVDNTQRLTAASARQRGAIEETMRRLPGVLDSAHTAADNLTDLSGALQPVASDLRSAGPRLNEAIDRLPGVSAKLRRLLPTLDETVHTAAPTLRGIPDFGDDLRDQIIPRTRDILQDINPMVEYLRPYGPELGAFLANFNAIVNYTDEAGNHYFRTFLTGNDANVPTPFDLKGGLFTYYNPIPKPGTGSQPGPFTGKFPRLERQSR